MYQYYYVFKIFYDSSNEIQSSIAFKFKASTTNTYPTRRIKFFQSYWQLMPDEQKKSVYFHLYYRLFYDSILNKFFRNIIDKFYKSKI